jgi:hypothetical protein
MRRLAHHKVRFTDAVAPTLDGCWAYSPQMDCWEYILYASSEGFNMLNIHGDEYVSTRPIEIEALSPVKVEGTNRDNYIWRAGLARIEAGWAY